MPSCLQSCINIPQRWIIILTCFLGLLNNGNVQICLSIAITQMVKPINHTVIVDNDVCTSETLDVQSYGNESIAKGMIFDWDEKLQGQILSSYYWGFIITCLLSGSILEKLDGKRTMGLSILSTSLLTLILPISVEFGGATYLIVVRFLAGFGSGVINSATMKLMSRWIPQDERSWAASWSFAGGTFGYIIGMAASGVIMEHSESGWPAVFYIYGAFGLFTFCVQWAICYDSPSEHPFISEAELKLLREKLKHSHAKLPATPWHHIVRSKAIWALTIALIGNGWCHVTMISVTPKFMSSVLKLNVEANGYVSAIPHVAWWIVSCSLSWLSDRLIANRITTTAFVRKIGNTLSCLGTAIFVSTTYVGCDRTLVIALLVVATALFGCLNFSTLVNSLDLAPNYAGAIHGIILGLCICVSFMSPYVAGWLTPDQTVEQWRHVFLLIFTISAITNLFFLLFGEAEVQVWNEPDYLRRHSREKSGEDAELNVGLMTTKKIHKIEIVANLSK